MNTHTDDQKCRVLHAITRLIVGGAQENTMYTAALLDPDRFQVQVLSGPQTGSEGSLIEQVRARGVPLTILPDLLRQVSPLHDLKALWRLWRYIKDGKYTVVHTHSSKAGILGRLAARLAQTPVIIHTVHGWSFHDYMHPVVRQMYILLERWMATFSDALIVVSEQDRKKGLEAGIGRPEQYHLIRSAIPLDEFCPAGIDRQAIRSQLGIPPGAVVIGNVGRFSAQKNPLDWVRIAGKIARACPDVFFLLVGDGPLRDNVEEEIRKEGIQDRILLTGLRRDVRCLLAAMDIFLMTSLWEGLPRSLAQAMAMGLPVVANRVDGVAEGIQDGRTGYLVHPGELDQAAQYCIHLAQGRVAREAFGKRGRKFARASFDLRTMITQIEDIYDAIVSQSQPERAAHPERRVGELRPVPVGAAWLNPPQLAGSSSHPSLRSGPAGRNT
jgi:glycosyltransferase involved in cell wall biosynthesis